MTKQLLIIFFVSLTMTGYSQGQKEKLRAIRISIPIIWNNSEATYYQLGSPKYPSGKAISYGININYSRTIYKNLLGIIGIGYFKQAFGISRPFEFDSPTNLLFHTESYKYDNIQLLVGLGYSKYLKNEFSIKGSLYYNHFFSFRQKYIVNKEYKTWQINKKAISLGNMVNMNVGIEKTINRRISIGIDATLPILTHWNNDEMFIKSFYSENSQQIGRNKFSIGTNISCIYHF